MSAGQEGATAPLMREGSQPPAQSANIFMRAWNYFTPRQQAGIILTTGAVIGALIAEGGERLAQHYDPMPSEGQSIGSEVGMPIVGAIAGTFFTALAMCFRNGNLESGPALIN